MNYEQTKLSMILKYGSIEAAAESHKSLTIEWTEAETQVLNKYFQRERLRVMRSARAMGVL